MKKVSQWILQLGATGQCVCFLHQVSVGFSDDKKKPGEKTTLILKAKPGSRVAFVAVDKSVHLLRAGNELSKDKVSHFDNDDDDDSYNNNNITNSNNWIYNYYYLDNYNHNSNRNYNYGEYQNIFLTFFL